MASIAAFPGAVVMVTHSERILRELATKLVIFHHGVVELFLGTYDDFLEKVGWEEEGAARPSRVVATPRPASAVTPKLAKETTRKCRAKIVAMRSQALAPLKKEITRLERGISHLEGEQSQANAALLAASQSGNGIQIAELSKHLSHLIAQIETHFESLVTVTRDHDDKVSAYEAQLTAVAE